MALEEIPHSITKSSRWHYSSTVVAPCTRYGCCTLGHIATRAPYLVVCWVYLIRTKLLNDDACKHKTQ